MLQGDSAQEEWKLILQEWGKADEEISPEEELLLFFLSHGAKSTDSRLVKATLMDGSYFGWSRDQVQQRPRPCLIM
jgi:CRISPR/Cas system endoribonuclease Cas6 (RAMP superfamily)